MEDDDTSDPYEPKSIFKDEDEDVFFDEDYEFEEKENEISKYFHRPDYEDILRIVKEPKFSPKALSAQDKAIEECKITLYQIYKEGLETEKIIENIKNISSFEKLNMRYLCLSYVFNSLYKKMTPSNFEKFIKEYNVESQVDMLRYLRFLTEISV